MMRPAKAKSRRVVQRGGIAAKEDTLTIVLALFNTLLGGGYKLIESDHTVTLIPPDGAASATPPLLMDSSSETDTTPDNIALTSSLAQIEMYLKIKLVNFGLPDYDGAIFKKDSGFIYYVNSNTPVIDDDAPSILTRASATISPATLASATTAPPPVVTPPSAPPSSAPPPPAPPPPKL